MVTAMKARATSERRFALRLFHCLLSLSAWSAGASLPFDSLRNAQCDSWQTSDGLPNHDVVSLVQTSDGYIWVGMFGSTNSLVRFNGFEFVPEVGLAGVGGNTSTCLAVGKNGRLWISKASGTDALILWQQGKATPVEIRLPPPVNWGVPFVPLYEEIGRASCRERV